MLSNAILHCDNVRLVSSPAFLISLIILSVLSPTPRPSSFSISPSPPLLSPTVTICQTIRCVARCVDLAYRKVHPLCNKYSIQSVNMRSMLICLNKCKFENPSWHFIHAMHGAVIYVSHNSLVNSVLLVIKY